MHRYIDVVVRRIVLHVQNVIHTVRDHPASSGKTRKKRERKDLLIESSATKFAEQTKVSIRS